MDNKSGLINECYTEHLFLDCEGLGFRVQASPGSEPDGKDCQETSSNEAEVKRTIAKDSRRQAEVKKLRGSCDHFWDKGDDVDDLHSVPSMPLQALSSRQLNLLCKIDDGQGL